MKPPSPAEKASPSLGSGSRRSSHGLRPSASPAHKPKQLNMQEAAGSEQAEWNARGCVLSKDALVDPQSCIGARRAGEIDRSEINSGSILDSLFLAVNVVECHVFNVEL